MRFLLGGYTKMNGVQKGMVFKVGNNLSTRKGENRETIVSWLGLSLLVGLAFILFSLFHQPMISQANEPTQEKHFMVYYRAWRDKTMQGVNTTLPDENWLTMHDIPYGIDIVNVFSYVPKGQEALAQPFYDTLKNEYAPALHARGVRLVRGIDYSELLKVPYAGTTPTEAEFDAYAKELLTKFVDDLGIDGLDIDMETRPSEKDIVLSNGVIRALSKYIGPKSGTDRPFLYDTNAEYLPPLQDVSDCFDFLAYQQYGSDDQRTQRALNNLSPVLNGERFVPGLTFPEEQDRNRWYDTKEPYMESNMYKVARYSYENNLGGMFLYALDRDGRTYNEDDLNQIKPSNLLWTKTAIAESKGVSLAEMKAAAQHYLKRISYANTDLEAQNKAAEAVTQATTLYDVNKDILGGDYGQGISNIYDAELEKGLLAIDLTTLYRALDQAVTAIEKAESYTPETIQALQTTKETVATELAGKTYTSAQVTTWQTEVQTALDNLKEKQTQPLKSVFSIDAGRKYFSVEQLEELVAKASQNGYTDVQLILGNDGLRFILDDMSVNVNGKKYNHNRVSKAIQRGNNAYYNDPNGNALTQKEMDRLLAFAKARNINIIPVINSPGHMDALLVAMEKLAIKNPAFDGSKRTVDLGNQKAVNFTKAIISKYVAYFSTHSEIFNFGGDEYANDVDTGGWAKLQSSGRYKDFVAYANDLAKIIKDAGMQPMSFNDGIYYNSDDSFGTFDPEIIISYWTAGWSGYDVAKPEYFVQKGHKIFNTNDAWYWVAGNVDSGIYQYDDALANMSKKAFTDVPAGSPNLPIIGSIQCVWYDDPRRDYDFERIYTLMDTFSENYREYMVVK